MADNAEMFSVNLHAFAQKVPQRIGAVVRKVSIDLLTATILRTPVGNPDLWKNKHPPKGYVGGRLRANWNVSIGVADTTTANAIDKEGSATIARGSQAVANADGTQDVFIMNSLPYALPVEYRHSAAQAPAGMVRVTVAQFQQFVDEAVREVNA